MPISNYSTTRDNNAAIAPGNIRSDDFKRDQQLINSIRQLMADLAGLTAGNDAFYEFGSWTPGFAFGGGTVGITYGARTGEFVKIGKMVVAEFDLTLTAKGTSTGSAALTGLPFTHIAGLSGGAAIGLWSSMALANQGLELAILSSDTRGAFRSGGTASSSVVDDTHFTDTTSIAGTAIYIAQ